MLDAQSPETGTKGKIALEPVQRTDSPNVKVVEGLAPMQKAGLLQAVAQLDMMGAMFPNAPERVMKAHREFVESLKEWANA